MTVLLSTGFGVALGGEEGKGGCRQLKDHRGGGTGGAGILARLRGSRHHLSLVPGTGGGSPRCGEAED